MTQLATRSMHGALAMALALAASLAPSTVSADDSTDAVAIPPPPGAIVTEAEDDPARPPAPPPYACEGSAVLAWHEGAWRCHTTGYVFGPSAEGILGGAAIFGAFYLIQVLSTAISTAQGQHDVGPGYPASRLADYERWGYAPLLGPWAKLVLQPPHVDEGGETLFVIEGLFELAGVTMSIVSLFTHQADVFTAPAGTVSARVVPTGSGLRFDLVF